MAEPAGRPVLELTSMAAGAVLGLAALVWAFGGTRTTFEDLALGPTTRAVYARVDGAPIHCHSLEDADECIAGFRARGAPTLTLWLGNSQLHGVNRLEEGQENAPPLLFRRLRSHGEDLIAFSQPNANLQEHLVLFSYLRSRLPVKRLILPVVFDDLRETGIRGNLLAALDDPATREALAAHEVGRRILEDQSNMAAGDLAALDQTVQEYSETALNDWLDEHSELWRTRPEARGQLFTRLYELRNRVFGIDAQSVRQLIPGRYAINMAAAKAILSDARAAGISVLLYVVPLRDDVKTPYDPEQYARFQREIADLATAEGAVFANLSSLVPAEDWGMKNTVRLNGKAEIDFMHFRAAGHALLARAIGDLMERRFFGAGS